MARTMEGRRCVGLSEFEVRASFISGMCEIAIFA